MGDIENYTVERADGTQVSDYAFDDYIEARDLAYANKARVIVNEYSFDDSHMLDDFSDESDSPDESDTPGGADATLPMWAGKPRERNN